MNRLINKKNVFNLIKEINRLKKEINRLSGNVMSNIYLKVTIEKNRRSQNLRKSRRCH